MTKSELKRIAEETARQMFPSKDKYEIRLTELPHNGLGVTIMRLTPEEKLSKIHMVGFGCRVYAIAGESNVVKKIKNAYGAHAE